MLECTLTNWLLTELTQRGASWKRYVVACRHFIVQSVHEMARRSTQAEQSRLMTADESFLPRWVFVSGLFRDDWFPLFQVQRRGKQRRVADLFVLPWLINERQWWPDIRRSYCRSFCLASQILWIGLRYICIRLNGPVTWYVYTSEHETMNETFSWAWGGPLLAPFRVNFV